MSLKEIPITAIEGFKIGNAQDLEKATGCTVIICEKGAVTGADFRGGASASRESALLDPLAANNGVHAVLLSGGSAFGLDAAGGVMKYLEEKKIGFPVGDIVVPIVCQSDIYDLQLVANAHPDQQMAYQACVDAEKNDPKEGNVGAGTGATCGKLLGDAGMMKTGLGIYAAQLGDLKVGAVVSVNALGDVYDYQTNKKIAGLRDPKTGAFLNTEETLFQLVLKQQADANAAKEQPQNTNTIPTNTTIACVITNAALPKPYMAKVAGMAHNGFARSIRPVHTMHDGDTIYAMTTGEVKADVNLVGIIASKVMSEAIKRSATQTEGKYGVKAARDMA